MARAINGWAKWVAIFVVIALAVGGWVWNAATVYSRVEQVDADNKEDHPKIQENREKILTIQRDVQYIREGVDRIDKKLDR
jgi:uncharacterized protein HemX